MRKESFLGFGKEEASASQEGTAHGVGFQWRLASYILAGSKLFAQSSL